MKRKFYSAERLNAIAKEVSAWPLTTSQDRTGEEKKVSPSAEERKIVFNIVYSALVGFNSHCNGGDHDKEQAICDMAEILFDNFTDWKYNGYVSLYTKLKEILAHWEVE